jgi:Ni/Fe-hydrogenase 1 B-type cytochrome subunit
MNQKELTSEIETTPFIQKHSAMIRVWHWITFLTISASLITVLFASTVLKPRTNIKMVQDQMQRKGVTVTEEQAFAVSHGFEDTMWDLHKLLGFGLTFLLAARLIIEVAQPGDEKLTVRIKKVLKLQLQNSGNKSVNKHYLIVKRGYIAFYALLLVMVLTGLGLAFGHDLAFLNQNHKLIKTIHSFCQYLMYGYIFLHLCGVIIAETGRDKGIVSGMINGN